MSDTNALHGAEMKSAVELLATIAFALGFAHSKAYPKNAIDWVEADYKLQMAYVEGLIKAFSNQQEVPEPPFLSGAYDVENFQRLIEE